MSRGRAPLDGAFDSPESKQRYVRRLFSTIAHRYDLITVVLSFGLDRRWKRRALRLATPVTGTRVLDLACGTGDLAFAGASKGASVVGLDVTLGMLQIARSKHSPPSAALGARRPAGADPGSVTFVQADMMALPFAAHSFEIVTIGYGLRNVPELRTALHEIHRVLRPGGRMVSLDFNHPRHRVVRAIYLAHLTVVGSILGWLLHRDPDTYRYIPASILRYPGAPAIVRMLEEAGFTRARWTAVLGGLMSIHVAEKKS